MYQATARYIRLSTKKAVQVIGLVQKRPVNDALTALAFTPNKSARVIEKLIKSAMANAQNVDRNIDIENLYIKELRIGNAPYLRRFRPQAMGRAARIRKPMINITIVLDIGEKL